MRTKDKQRTRDSPELQEILTVEQIGPRRMTTPEGFLLCKDVPIARIGTMVYGPGELPLTEGVDGLVYVTRTAEELFRPETLASFAGKPVTDEHPEDDVTPDNWAALARGTALNVRQGDGSEADVILADLLITDARMIKDIEAKKREVSAGYDADYEQTGEGQGLQSNIIGNHIALVERGRCGPRCAIGDHAHKGNLKMATQATRKASTPARKKISKATLDALVEQLSNEEDDASTMDDGELTGKADGGTHIHIHGIGGTAPATQGAGVTNVKDEGGTVGGTEGNGSTVDPKTEARFASLENGHKEIIAQLAALTKAISGKGDEGGEDPSGTKDEKEDEDKEDKKDEDKENDKTKTKDSAALETSYKEVLAGCEVLVPGFRMPTFDAARKRTTTIDTMCSARRKALDAYSASADGMRVVTEVAGTKTVDVLSMDCPNLATLFKATVGAKRLMNNSGATRDANKLPAAQGARKGPMSLAELNEQNRKFYAGTR